MDMGLYSVKSVRSRGARVPRNGYHLVDPSP